MWLRPLKETRFFTRLFIDCSHYPARLSWLQLVRRRPLRCSYDPFHLEQLVYSTLCTMTGLGFNVPRSSSKGLWDWSSKDPAACDVMRQHCAAIHTAENMFNRTRPGQLHRMAELFKTFPTMLKRASDSSKISPWSPSHNISVVRREASTVLNDRQSSICFIIRQLFKFEHFPLVPVDSCLRLFIKVLDKLALPRGDSGVYALAVMQDIQTAIEGLAYVFTLPDPVTRKEPKIFRTKYNPYSAALSNWASGDCVPM